VQLTFLGVLLTFTIDEMISAYILGGLNGGKMKSTFLLMALVTVTMLTVSCTREKEELGSKDNPIKFFLVPSVDAKLLETSGEVIRKRLEELTPYKFKFAVPSSYVAVVESFGTNRADVASINTFGYLMANERYGVEAKIIFLRNGLDTYKAQIIARADGPIKTLKDISGKKFAYVDPASTSGYLLPAKMFLDQNIKPKETIFAKKHDNVVMMVYQHQVDAGATFYSEKTERGIEDARRLVKTQFPDVEEKIKIVTLTDSIPNDPIVFRKEVPQKIKEQVTAALIKLQSTEEGKKLFYDIYGITGMTETTDEKYNSVRGLLKTLGKSSAELTR
jgi:phosphonate transport system substrate-binding protein